MKTNLTITRNKLQEAIEAGLVNGPEILPSEASKRLREVGNSASQIAVCAYEHAECQCPMTMAGLTNGDGDLTDEAIEMGVSYDGKLCFTIEFDACFGTNTPKTVKVIS